MIAEGQKAPEIRLPDETGTVVTLGDFPGKKKVIYFYPRDNTPGCTKEACGLRDVYDQILAKGAVVLGISADSPKSHASFKTKFDLPFHLLSDEEKTVIQAFGAWGEKQNYGKKYMGIIRSTFVLDEHDVVIKVFPKVSPEQHPQEVLEVI